MKEENKEMLNKFESLLEEGKGILLVMKEGKSINLDEGIYSGGEIAREAIEQGVVEEVIETSLRGITMGVKNVHVLRSKEEEGESDTEIENQNIVDAYGFQVCPVCKKRQGTVLGPIGSYALLCAGCAERLDEAAKNDPICRMKSREMRRQLTELSCGDEKKQEEGVSDTEIEKKVEEIIELFRPRLREDWTFDTIEEEDVFYKIDIILRRLLEKKNEKGEEK